MHNHTVGGRVEILLLAIVALATTNGMETLPLIGVELWTTVLSLRLWPKATGGLSFLTEADFLTIVCLELGPRGKD